MEEAAEQTYILSSDDMCDKCHIAIAYVQVITPKGELNFCKHHYEEHSDAITKAEYVVIDEREKLLLRFVYADIWAEGRTNGRNR